MGKDLLIRGLELSEDDLEYLTLPIKFTDLWKLSYRRIDVFLPRGIMMCAHIENAGPQIEVYVTYKDVQEIKAEANGGFDDFGTPHQPSGRTE